MAAGAWCIGKLVPASGGAGFTTGLTLDVPAGSGYQAIVAYRSTAGSGALTSFGTSSGSFTVTATTLAIGDRYQGGIVDDVLRPGDPGYDANVQHGLIAAEADQSAGIQWYNSLYVATGAAATALFTGSANTTTIIAVQGPIATSHAAGLARACNSEWRLHQLVSAQQG